MLFRNYTLSRILPQVSVLVDQHCVAWASRENKNQDPTDLFQTFFTVILSHNRKSCPRHRTTWQSLNRVKRYNLSGMLECKYNCQGIHWFAALHICMCNWGKKKQQEEEKAVVWEALGDSQKTELLGIKLIGKTNLDSWARKLAAVCFYCVQENKTLYRFL